MTEMSPLPTRSNLDEGRRIYAQVMMTTTIVMVMMTKMEMTMSILVVVNKISFYRCIM